MAQINQNGAVKTRVPKTEKRPFRKGLDQLSKMNGPTVRSKIMKILDVKSKSALYRHANGELDTSYELALKIEKLFLSIGITKIWGTKKVKQTVKSE